MNTDKIPFIVRLPLVLISIVILGYVLYLGQFILAPFTFAFFTAIMFLPFSNALENKFRFSRGWSTIASVLVLMSILLAIGYFFASQLSDLVNDWPHLQKQMEKLFHELQIWMYHSFNINIHQQTIYLQQGAQKLLSTGDVLLGVTIGAFSSSLFFVFLTVIFFMSVLNYRGILYRFITSVFTQRHVERVDEIVSKIQIMVKQYLVGLIIQILIVFVIVSSFLSIMGVKYAILLGALTGFLNVIPYIGIGLSMLITLFIALATGSSANLFVLMLGFLATHSIDANVTLPFIVGSKVKINAFFSFLAILVGEAFWGISGMFLCIPVLGVLKIIFDRVEGLEPWGMLIGDDDVHSSRKKKKKKKKEEERENSED